MTPERAQVNRGQPAHVFEQMPSAIAHDVKALMPIAPEMRSLAREKSYEEIAKMFCVSALAVRVLLEGVGGDA